MKKNRRYVPRRSRPARDEARDAAPTGVDARERLERKWFHRVEIESSLAPYVVGDEGDREPLHRWLPYRQGFSPRLVRRFLSEGELADGPVLDPFGGSGTTAIESVRRGRPAVSIEPLASLAALTRIRLGFRPRAARDLVPPVGETPEEAYASCTEDLQRAAVLMTVARSTTAEGRIRQDAPPFPALLAECIRWIIQDASHAPKTSGVSLRGDARRLPLSDGSISGIFTSPPYLSRYDYAALNHRLETLYAGGLGGEAPPALLSAHPRAEDPRSEIRGAGDAFDSGGLESAVMAEILEHLGRKKEAAVAAEYFAGLAAFVREAKRVLAPGAPLTVVLAGARFGGQYIPSDLLFAALCEAEGLAVEEILQVRTLGPARKLGGLDQVAPRESIISARQEA